jgi:hypothetical protein
VDTDRRELAKVLVMDFMLAPVTHTPIRCVGIIDPVPDEPRMVFLGFSKFARADKICSLSRLSGRSRVDAKRG